MFRVLGCGVGLLLLANVVGALTEGGLPVLLVQIRVVFFVEGAGTGRWVSVLDFFGDVVVVVTLDAHGHTEGFEPIASRLPCLAEEFINHL